MTKYMGKYIGLFAGLMLLAVLSGCKKETVSSSAADKSGDVLHISTRMTSDGTAAENAVRTLRLFVFDAGKGTLLLNKLYKTDEAGSVVPGDSYTYFVRDAQGDYLISEMFPKTTVKILLVANEMAAFNAADYTVDQVKGTLLDYAGMYGDQNGLDIQITGTGTASNNKGYAPMFAESEAVPPGNWNASNGKVLRLPLERVLAKVVLKVRNSGGISDPAFLSGDQLIIRSASIGHVPRNSFLGNTAFLYQASLINVKAQSFTRPITIEKSSGEQSTDVLVFYMPEYRISDAWKDNGQYAAIQINAEYVSGGETTSSRYSIPLGDGVQKLYDPLNPVPVEQLTVADLTVSRNTQYNIEASVTTFGTLELTQVVVSVKDWEKTELIDGTVDVPVLNVSNLDVKMAEEKVRVYFWTNQSDPNVAAAGLNGNTPIAVNDVFKPISGAGATHFKVLTNADNQYYPYNGYIEFEFDDPAVYNGASDIYTVILNAGRLQRSIKIEANPVVGQVFFDPNGGTITDGTVDLRLSEVGGLGSLPLLGNIHTMDDPQVLLTPPSGKTFVGWSYQKAGSSSVSVNPDGTLSVRLEGSTTRLFAVWH